MIQNGRVRGRASSGLMVLRLRAFWQPTFHCSLLSKFCVHPKLSIIETFWKFFKELQRTVENMDWEIHSVQKMPVHMYGMWKRCGKHLTSSSRLRLRVLWDAHISSGRDTSPQSHTCPTRRGSFSEGRTDPQEKAGQVSISKPVSRRKFCFQNFMLSA